MLRLFSILFILLVGSTLASGQHLPEIKCHSAKSIGSAARTTVADPAEDNYDVTYVKLDVAANNYSTSIGGNVTTRARALVSLSAYVFELDPVFTVDSVHINGMLRPLTTSGVVRSVAFASPLAAGSLFTARVFYHGAPPPGPVSPMQGINTLLDPYWNVPVTYTQSEPYTARDWWPCKQSLLDKIDSVDVWVTVPDTLKAGSNGLLQNVTHVDATHNRYEWKHRFPIDYYLISIAIANYTDHSYYMHFTGSSDSMLVQNYVYPAMMGDPYSMGVLDSTGMMVDYFSTLYGRYPFWKEKYGHCIVHEWGAMEHQTMTTQGSSALDVSTVAHELGHQWWGDNVTCGTWRDITMNEGFATYSAALFEEHFHSPAAMYEMMNGAQATVKIEDSGTVYTVDTSFGRVFSGRLSYAKGACVINMLRWVINDDAAFFSLLQSYQLNRKFGNGTIEDFKNTAKALLGTTVNSINLDTFFHQWMYREGYPKYAVRWDQVGNDVYLRIDQGAAVPGSVPYFSLPVELTLHGATGDTTIRLLVNQPTQSFQLSWSKTMNNATVDPRHWLIYSLSAFVRDHTLAIEDASLQAVRISPNPAKTNWVISDIPANSMLTLADMTGRLLWQTTNTGAQLQVSTDQLAAGVYMLRVTTREGRSHVYKLVRE